MKRLATLAFLIVAAMAPQAGAGSLPTPASPLGRTKPARVTHGLRSDARPKLPKPVALSQLDRYRTVHLTHGMRVR
jgi:hypothetical protein